MSRSVVISNSYLTLSSGVRVAISAASNKRSKISCRSASGQFQTYKGRELDLVVDAANFYGIHLDVAKLTVK